MLENSSSICPLFCVLFHKSLQTCIKLWPSDTKMNKAEFILPRSFSCCPVTISDCLVIGWSSRALTLGFEVRLVLSSPVITFQFMSPLFLKKNSILEFPGSLHFFLEREVKKNKINTHASLKRLILIFCLGTQKHARSLILTGQCSGRKWGRLASGHLSLIMCI